jgi:phospholipase/carboxylesterase
MRSESSGPPDGGTVSRPEPWVLSTRPGDPSVAPLAPGLSRLGLRSARDAWLYVPAGRAATAQGPLVIVLHGAGGSGRDTLRIFQGLADQHQLLLLAPESVGASWDIIATGLGPDVATLDRALAWVFARFAVDQDRIAITGFSDGASYALTVGLANGALFTHVIAFSPGFAAPPRRQGAPRLFVSHGVRDRVLPIDTCSRRIVPRLQRAGYDVTYVEFDGPHTVPAEIAARAVRWLQGGRGPDPR